MHSGALWNVLGSSISAGSGMLMLMLVSWTMDIETIGVFGIAYTTACLFYNVGVFGVNTYHMTDYGGEYPYRGYFAARIVSVALMMLIAVAAIPLLGFSWMKSVYLLLLTAYMGINVFAESHQCQMFRDNRLDRYGQSMFLRILFTLLVFSLVLFVTGDLVLSLVAQIVGNAAGALFFSRKWPVPRDERKPSCRMSFWILRTCVPLFVSGFAGALLMTLPQYGIEYFCTDEVQGNFILLYKLPYVINLLCSFIFAPLFYRYAVVMEGKRWRELWRMVRRHVLLVFGMALCCTVGAYLLGIPVLELLFRRQIPDLRAELLLLMFGAGFMGAAQPLRNVLVLARKKGAILLGDGIGILTALAATGLVKSYEIMGAACVYFFSFAAMFMVSAVELFLLSRHTEGRIGMSKE